MSNMNNLTSNAVQIVSADASKNEVLIELIEIVKEHPETVVALFALASLTLVSLKYINAKYHYETTISLSANEGIKYVSKPITVISTTTCLK